MKQRLTRRRLNRATLTRQLLTGRAELSAEAVIEQVGGVQAQDPEPPYIGLWNRIDGFRRDDLATLLDVRAVVRATLHRGTQHLVTAEDYLWLRPTLEPMLRVRRKGAFGRLTAGVDPEELAAAARSELSGRTTTRPELGRALAGRWPGRDPVALASSAQMLLPVLHPPPAGLWGRRGPVPFALAEDWLGRALTAEADPARLVLRHLAAFGPATVGDVQAWSGTTRLREVVDGLRPRLRQFGGEDGEELLDLPDAPLPEEELPVPVRFLALLDDVVLGHADRARLMTAERRRHLVVEPAVLVDGFVRGLWSLAREADGRAVLTVRLFSPLTPRERQETAEEGAALLRFAVPDADRHDIRFASVE
ncbi:winged helix DNA-binding domain-containing protein [Streptomyces abyssomicinicus]|uniref:winged helix DNA-binding domain-containing protein n=1 Tax=Streptomyces abyssomicinicus TaxID=574929 RepID=UPI0012502F4B|nr:winged helix DNA-binding domain-containing protein [Streptomyces abyssomicinicus]